MALITAVTGEYIKSFNNIINENDRTVQLAVTPGHIGEIEPVFQLSAPGRVTPSGRRNLSRPVTYTVSADGGQREEWTVSAVEWGNSLLGQYGLFGDPNIVMMDGRYYIYPTTDGVSGWKSTYFKAFSSDDLVHWRDEGVILDLKDVPWSLGMYGWAPTAAERNGKYYFYYSSGNKLNGHKDLAVAVADSPNGPFVDKGEPLMPGGILEGQMIDPHAFIDDDGTPYLYWGNGQLYAARLSEDMTSFDGEIKKITPEHFTEAVFVIKRGGRYYFTWSEGNTENPDYCVRYGVSGSPLERPEGCGVILSRDYTGDSRIQCTGHHSIINIPGTDDWYICYHRFNIPTTVQIGGGYYAGSHREVALDRMEFDESGAIKPVLATLEGVTAPVRTGG